MEAFTSIRDLSKGFARTMNLISQEVQDHHEKVSYIAYRLAESLQMTEPEKLMAILGGLVHDVGGVTVKSDISLAELEAEADELAKAGSGILKYFPFPLPLSDIVADSQTPWEKLKEMYSESLIPQRLSQIVHLSDIVTLLLDPDKPILNQVSYIKECINKIGTREFSPEVLGAFEDIANKESLWMDLLYRPELFLEFIPDHRILSLDETVMVADFMSRIIDLRSPFTAMHSAGVAATAISLAEKFGMSDDECKMMRIAGYLHDIGKLKVPNSIIEKPGKLTPEEFNVMKEHAYYTYIILKDIKGFDQIAGWAAFHHEKLGGTGYPFHLEGSMIPLGSRIMTVADIFSALTEERPYRKGMEKEQVISIMEENVRKGETSRTVTDMLLRNYDEINRRRYEASAARLGENSI